MRESRQDPVDVASVVCDVVDCTAPLESAVELLLVLPVAELVEALVVLVASLPFHTAIPTPAAPSTLMDATHAVTCRARRLPVSLTFMTRV
jgi:hypothetical protein